MKYRAIAYCVDLGCRCDHRILYDGPSREDAKLAIAESPYSRYETVIESVPDKKGIWLLHIYGDYDISPRWKTLSTDLTEAIAMVLQQYPTDKYTLSVRNFNTNEGFYFEIYKGGEWPRCIGKLLFS